MEKKNIEKFSFGNINMLGSTTLQGHHLAAHHTTSTWKLQLQLQ